MENQGLDSIKDNENPFDPRVHRFVSTEDREMAIHRHLCDTYMHPRYVGCSRGATMFYVNGKTHVRGWAKEALKFYNWKQQKNFYLEKVVKLNTFAANSYMTFWARSAESGERCLFRAAVTGGGGSKVLLCEIRDDVEITIPADHPEICFDEDLYSPPYSPPRNKGSFTTNLTSVTCLGGMSDDVEITIPADHPEICFDEDQSSPPRNKGSFTTYLTSVTWFGGMSMAVLVVLMISAVAKLFVMLL